MMDLFTIAGFGTNLMFSLGIIFVVIFVVFYIRQRITNLDNKVNSMFELIHAMADEINVIKQEQIKQEEIKNSNNTQEGGINSVTLNPFIPNMNSSSIMNPMNSELLQVSDDEEEESEYETETDSDDEDVENDESRILKIDETEQTFENLVFDEITKKDTSNDESDTSGEKEIAEIDQNDLVPETHDDENVAILELENQEANVREILEEDIPLQNESKLIENLQLNDFSKMTVKELRSYIRENSVQYNGDISKMKKTELINLCQ